MKSEVLPFRASDEVVLHRVRWSPEAGTSPRGVVHIAHGMSEHIARYAHVAEALVGAGFVVYGHDHRGHGKTAPSPEALGFFALEGGFERVVQDLEEMIVDERRAHADLPVILFGHSMGSYIAQWFVTEHGRLLRGLILSGTAGKPPLIASAGRLLARAERARLGPLGKSALLESMSFERFNKQFAPNRTKCDWLSRDAAEVDKYIADPLCGFVCTTELWIDLLDALSEIAKPERQARIPKDLPVYVFCGAEDPVGENTKSVTQLLGAYRRAGLQSVTHRFYPGGRHEMVNETNREEVLVDVVAWLRQNIAAPVTA